MTRRKKRNQSGTLSGQLRAAILESGVSLQQLARDTGVDVGSVSRFVRAERTLTLDSADRLATRLRLVLQQEP